MSNPNRASPKRVTYEHPQSDSSRRLPRSGFHAHVGAWLDVWRWIIRLFSGTEQKWIVVTTAPCWSTCPACHLAKPFPGGISSVCAVGHDSTNISTELLPRKPLPYEFLFYYFAKANTLQKDMRYSTSVKRYAWGSVSFSRSLFFPL